MASISSGVDLGTQTVLEARLEHLTGLLHRKSCQPRRIRAQNFAILLLNERHHLLTHKGGVYSARFGFLLSGHKVRAHEITTISILLVEVADYPAPWACSVAAKTMLLSTRRWSYRRPSSPSRAFAAFGGQLLLGGSARGVSGGLDAAAGVLNFEVGLAMGLHAQLILPPTAEIRCVWASTRPWRDAGFPSASTISRPAAAEPRRCRRRRSRPSQ